jgi:hypothetical protein
MDGRYFPFFSILIFHPECRVQGGGGVERLGRYLQYIATITSKYSVHVHIGRFTQHLGTFL